MARFYMKFTIALLIVCGLTGGAAGVVGQWQHGELLVYIVVDNYNYSLNNNPLMIMDVNRLITIQALHLPPILASPTLGMNGFLVFQEQAPCPDLWLWDTQVLYNLTNTVDTCETQATWNSEGYLTYRACENIICDLWLWDGFKSKRLTNTLNLEERFPTWNVDDEFAYTACDVYGNCDVWLTTEQNNLNLTNTPTTTNPFPHGALMVN